MTFSLSRLMLAATACFVAVGASAQTTTGSITGTVTDPSGAVVPTAKITVTSEREGTSRDVVTNSAGVFSVPNLTIGPYSVRVVAPGFAQFETSHLMLTSNQVLNVDARLAVASAGTTVQVAAAGTGISTETSNISNLKT